MSFLAPAVLWALGLALVPIIIHLFNRRRFRTVDWAPMKYLLQAFRKHRRRLKLEEILLLVVRTAFVLLVVAALARPVAKRPGWPWQHVDARVARVLVLDDSLSMGYRSAPGTAFERQRRAAQRLLESFGEKDDLTVLATSAPDAPLFRTSPDTGRGVARAAVDALPLSDASCSMGAVLAAAAAHLQEATSPTRELVLVTDLRKTGWDAGVSPASEKLAAIGTRLRVIDAGEDASEDVAVESLLTATPAVFPGQQLQMVAKIRNSGREAFGPGSAQLRVGGSERTLAIPRIEPGGEAPVAFTAVFDRPGIHAVQIALPEDALPADGLRIAVVYVRERLDVVVVDGDPSPNAFEGESDFVAAALTVGDLPVRVHAQIDSEWLSKPPESADLTVICNLASMPPAQAGQLENLVKRGMGLMIFPGDQVDPDAWNDRLDRGGEGLLPAPIAIPRDAGLSGIAVAEIEASPLAPLRRLTPGALSSIQARRFVQLAPHAGAKRPARLLASWTGSGDAPAIVDRPAGAGRVVLWATTADRGWSDWPIDPSWVLAVRETAFDAARRGPAGLEREAGPPLLVRPEARVAMARLRAPGEEQDRAVEIRDDQDGPLLRCGPALRAGTYELSFGAESGAAGKRTIAVNPSASEATLTRWDREAFRKFVGPVETEIMTDADLESGQRDASREFWRTLMFASVILFLFESLLTFHLGREG